jgi:hypothetical protein
MSTNIHRVYALVLLTIVLFISIPLSFESVWPLTIMLFGLVLVDHEIFNSWARVFLPILAGVVIVVMATDPAGDGGLFDLYSQFGRRSVVAKVLVYLASFASVLQIGLIYVIRYYKGRKLFLGPEAL